MTSEQLMVGATIVVALATVVLAVLTGCYLKATNRLVSLQREPNVQVGIPDMLDKGQEVVVKNAGSDPVINIAIYPRHFVFGDPKKPPIMSHGRPNEKLEDNRNAWWFIRRLEPDETLKKSLVEKLKTYWQNHESMKRYAGNETEPSSLFLLDVDFEREIDRKAYQITKVAQLLQVEDTNGDKSLMLMEPMYQFSSLKQAIELNSTRPVRGDTLARRT